MIGVVDREQLANARHGGPVHDAVEVDPLHVGVVDTDGQGYLDHGGSVLVGRRRSAYSSTWKLNIIPLSWCSAMWQCAIHTPGLVTSSRMSMVWPVRTSTVSFQTRFSSVMPSRART